MKTQNSPHKPTHSVNSRPRRARSESSGDKREGGIDLQACG